MSSLSFENRVSLTRKSEDLIMTIEELSSSYAKREEFVNRNHFLFPKMRSTSEVCPVLAFDSICFFYSVTEVNLVFLISPVVLYEASVEAGANFAISDSTISKNIV